jgi:adenine-specific DNA-methyltransferase
VDEPADPGRDGAIVARELLTQSGSIFVQISNENVHLLRCVMDEVFGSDNFVTLITYKTSAGLGSSELSTVCD